MRKLNGLAGSRKFVASVAILCAAGAAGGAITLGATATPAAAQSADGAEVAAFYRSRGGAPLWFSPRSGAAAQQLVQLLATAQADNLNPRRYNARGLSRAVQDAATGNPAAVQRAEAMLSAAFVAYARDQRHDPGAGVDLCRSGAAADAAVCAGVADAAAQAPSLVRICRPDGLDEPDLRPAAAGDRQPDLSQRGANGACSRSTSSARGRFRRATGATSSSTRRRRGCTCTRTARSWTRCASSPAGPTRSRRRR